MHKYLVDANIFLQAKNLYYRFEFCSHFWSWMLTAHGAGLVCSINKVKKELTNGDKEDPARKWAEELPTTFFLADESDAKVMEKYAEIMAWTARSTHYKDQAKRQFADSNVADAFLLATAMAYGYDIITHELPNPERKNKIQLPDAASAFGIKTHYVYDILAENSNTDFSFANKPKI
ncbi:DUF4411 family protein [Pseudomonas sp. JH-2]|uniref:DUF4411 family protein n=1 Tax=Pseudomonas sp. JH-2 TaxID=3114998 RepID=UPI002E263297|nr:DUF4411 family protein [Pseudomonas sp. JH-2]